MRPGNIFELCGNIFDFHTKCICVGITNIFLDDKWEEAKARPGNIFELCGDIFDFQTKYICVEITNIFLIFTQNILVWK